MNPVESDQIFLFAAAISNLGTRYMYLMDGCRAPHIAGMDMFAEVQGNVVMKMETQQHQFDSLLITHNF